MKVRHCSSILLAEYLVCSVFATTVAAQNSEQGPWWPHPIWGADDQAGASNRITSEKILEAVRLVRTGKVYELGHIYERDMPLNLQRTYAMFSVGAPTYGPWGSNNFISNDEYLCAEIGQVGTQFDGLGHAGMRMTFADGSQQDVYYNGFTGDQVYSPYGLRKLGVEHIKPIITRGILVDIATYKGVEKIHGDYEVSVADVTAALDRQGVSPETIRPGDALLFRFGWGDSWKDPQPSSDGSPGVGLDVAKWAVAKSVVLVGGDKAEVVPSSPREESWPVHQELVMKNGIFLFENLNLEALAADEVYEFLFVFTPIRFKGATGSPGRPLAIH